MNKPHNLTFLQVFKSKQLPSTVWEYQYAPLLKQVEYRILIDGYLANRNEDSGLGH